MKDLIIYSRTELGEDFDLVKPSIEEAIVHALRDIHLNTGMPLAITKNGEVVLTYDQIADRYEDFIASEGGASI